MILHTCLVNELLSLFLRELHKTVTYLRPSSQLVGRCISNLYTLHTTYTSLAACHAALVNPSPMAQVPKDEAYSPKPKDAQTKRCSIFVCFEPLESASVGPLYRPDGQAYPATELARVSKLAEGKLAPEKKATATEPKPASFFLSQWENFQLTWLLLLVGP